MANVMNRKKRDARRIDPGEQQNTDKPCSSRIYRTTSRIQCFVGVISMYILTYLTMEVYFVAIITTLEKRFGLRSSQTGLLLSLREVASLSTAVPFSHLARNINKPKFLAVMGLIGSVGGFLYAVPYFIDSNPREYGSMHNQDHSSNFLCQNQTNGTVCESKNDIYSKNSAYIFLMLGTIIMGLSSSSFPSLSNTYIDDNSTPRKSAFYLGITNSMRPFGPMLGLLTGSIFLSIPENTRAWEGSIGAWWLGYIVIPLVFLIPSVCLLFFPKYSRGVRKNPEKKEAPDKNKSAFLASLKRLLTNPPYILCAAGACFSSFVYSGMLPFLPKYIETQFRASKTASNMITGMAGTMLAGIGIFIGGVISSKLAVGPRKSAVMLALANLIYVISLLLNMALGCPTEEIIGLNSKKNISCTPLCQCSPDVFLPVCHISTQVSPDFATSDGTFHHVTSDNVTSNDATFSHVTLASACYAGCTPEYSNKTYTNCNCTGSGQVISGMCPSDCNYLIPFVINFGIGALFVMIGTIPGLTVMLRIVKQEDNTLALGVVSTVTIICSFIPGPVLYGTLIDGACLKWSKSCEGEGSCLFYNNDKFRFRLYGMTAAFKFIATLMYGLVVYLIRNDKYIIARDYTEEEIGDNETQTEVSTAV